VKSSNHTSLKGNTKDIAQTLVMVQLLEEAFPDRCPSLIMTDREIWFYAGKVSLIKFMRAKLEEATESIPEVLT